MWIFGQVWFACLVGFAVGVLLDWVIRVRPLNRRVAELEARLAANARAARQDGEYGRSVFDRGPFASAGMTPDGFVADRNRGGLLTPSGGGRTEVLEPGGRDGQTGVEDFPGVARLSEQWEEAEEATRAAPEPWQPVTSNQHQPAEDPWEAEQATEPEPAAGDWQPTESADAPTQVNWLSERPTPAEPTAAADGDADADYLEFLRAGANHAPTDPAIDDEDDAVTQGEMTDAGQGDATGVMPQIEGYEAYESYADEYEQNGQQTNGYAENYGEYQYGEYQPEEYEEPAESASPLPRRGAHSESRRFAPFEIPFDAPSDADLVDVQPNNGELTPIEEGGFQPFQKPPDVEPVGYDGAWMGDDGQIVDNSYDGPPTNGAYRMPHAEEGEPSSWFDLSEAGAQVGAESGMTQRMLPVSRPDLDHPDLLPESVFGTETDTLYAEEGPSRSLFEPVIQPDALEDSFQAPAYERPGYGEQAYQQPAYIDQPYTDQPYTDQPYTDQGYGDRPYTDQGYGEHVYGEDGNGATDDVAPEQLVDAPTMTETTTEFQTPPPIRVRTGVDGPITQTIRPIVPDSGDGTAQPEGPFGAGSALPAPDGSAPAPEFTVKARTSSMVFHTESSPFYDRLEPQVWFRSPEDAQRAGFTSWERPRNW